MSKIKLDLKVPVSFFREGKAFIAYSPVLDLSTSGRSFKEVQERFFEIVKIFFEELVEMGTLDEVLSELGWRKISRQWRPPMAISHEVTDISVPLS